MITYESNKDISHNCTYHITWCTKYRRKVLKGDIQIRLASIILNTCEELDCVLLNTCESVDHVCLSVKVPPRYGAHRLIKQIKGRSSRLLRSEFPELKSKIPTLWTNNYFIASLGVVTPSSIKNYIQDQKVSGRK